VYINVAFLFVFFVVYDRPVVFRKSGDDFFVALAGFGIVYPV